MSQISSKPPLEFFQLNVNNLSDNFNENRATLSPDSASRFRVDKVSNHGEIGGDDNEEEEDDDDDDNANDRDYHRRCKSNGKKASIDSSYDTKNAKSFRHYTREALPRVDHYRHASSVHGHISRPTLDELHGCDTESCNGGTLRKSSKCEVKLKKGEHIKFGWITGVFIRCLSGIWGIMLFLRMGWVVAHAGIGLGSVIILLSSVVTIVTALSMSAICTNGEVKGGGTYYMISRSLGPEFGGSIGVIFSLANAVAIAMYTIGFAETVNNILKVNGAQMAATELDNMRIIGCITIFLLLIIVLIGTEWEAKVQIVMIIVLVSSILDFLIGSLRSPDEEEMMRGFTGWSVSNIAENFGPHFRHGETFFSIFSVYFPAATGILAGANISGDLKDPQKAIPLGTLLAIIVTTLSYLLFVFIFGATTVREVLVNGTALEIDGLKQGMYHNYNLMEVVSIYGPIIYAGCFAAALSSALGSLVSAPKVFQALCKDKLFPCIHFFAKGSGRNNQPYRGYFLAFGIGLACCLVADLNLIAPIISNFFLAAYCLINFSCFHASFSKTLGFRPSFRYYNMWISLLGSVLCLVVMFIMNWQTALITFLIEFALYTLVLYRKPDVNWGSSTQAQTYRSALHAAHKLNLLSEHAKTYRPQILLLCGNTFARPPLIDFAYQIVKGVGMLICGHVVENRLSQKSRETMIRRNYEWLRNRGIKAFYSLVDEENLSNGAKGLIQATGVGKLRPNIVFLGYKNDWQTCPTQSLLEYFSIIHEAFDKHTAVCILRLQNGLDYSRYGRLSRVFESLEEKSHNAFLNSSFASSELSKSLPKKHANETPSTPTDGSSETSTIPNTIDFFDHVASDVERESDISKDVLLSIDTFRRKQPKSTIDVWWLYDDGGLTMLIPYIIATRKCWSDCRLRVFALADKRDDLNLEQRNMAALLNKFRIEYSDVLVIPGISNPPKEKSRQEFSKLLEKWRQNGESKSQGNCGDIDEGQVIITDSEYYALKNKSYRQMRLRELLEEHSMNASLIAITLPMPRKGSCSAPMFMAWLETITHDMPPFLLIRGTHQSVLTFYS